MEQMIYDISVGQYTRSMRSLKGMLLKARQFAKERNFDENNFLALKAAPDMFSLCKQVQIATDNVKATSARLSGKKAPVFEDNETTLEQLLQRIDKTIGFINEFSPKDFSNYEKAKVSFPWNKGYELEGHDYFTTYSIPNVYFHIMATYMLLRTHGVNLGKADYIGEINWKKQ